MRNIRSYLLNLIETASQENEKNIFNFIPKIKACSYLDLGCNDGRKSILWARKANSHKTMGIEIVKIQANKARKRGIIVYESDLNNKLPINSDSVDIITTNQVIEHLNDTDLFLSEIFRILKKNGVLILSTENLASWHNVFSLFCGFQPFSMSNFSIKGNIGNPFSLWKTKKLNEDRHSWLHKRLFSYYGLIDLLKKHGFNIVDVKTIGYYPFPNFLSHFLSHIDKIHG
ncbi:MAG: class I SAM-dependent methyltransferase, partial [bacterium]|nr:class I SAM-dependent methyltransferase [bacterium]